MHLIFIRHGDPDYKNDSLTQKGFKEAELLRTRVSRWHVEDFYTSPMGRAKTTAATAMKDTNRKAEVLPWLREFNYDLKDLNTGNRRIAWDWMPKDWISEPLYRDELKWFTTDTMKSGDIKKYRDLVSSGIDNTLLKYGYKRTEFPIYKCTPHLTEKESLVDTHLNPLQKNLDDKNIVFFCHLGVMFMIISHLTGISPVQLWQCFFVAPTSVTVLGTEERVPGEVIFRIQSLGDCAHLINNNESPSASGFFGGCFNL